MPPTPPMPLPAYLRALEQHHRTGTATEHTHRPALHTLLQTHLPHTLVTNEPRHIACGAPDFVITQNAIPLGYVEAKNIGTNLDSPTHKEQLKRYTTTLNNLIFTNYLEFRLYRHGQHTTTTRIAELRDDRIKPLRDGSKLLTDLLTTFADYHGQPITTAEDLAARMAAKARMLATVITDALTQDQHLTDTARHADQMGTDLQGNIDAFQKHLIADIQPAAFADIYAQTVAYGMFAARLHDPNPDTFTRQQAATLIPAHNPFLLKFFQHIAGYNLDPRIRWIVDDLADLFRAADVGALMKDYGKATQRNDPFMHFYETFLGKYDPKLRRIRGVYYTPEPVVNFIVRAVDDILHDDFNLPQGLADTSKTTIDIQHEDSTPRQQEVHTVQILDPATGTGTFLATIVRHIYDKYFATQKGTWPNYATTHLIPRLNGFELLMASYAMAHIKLEMVLRDTGCHLGQQRLRVFLTNSLEEHKPAQASWLDQWLSNEGKEAGAIKRDTPVMVVIGNPPYSGHSANKGGWVANLLTQYKQEPNGGKLRERNSKWINDDYVKFIRYGQYCIDRTGEGVLAYISNNGFLGNQTFRGMRWSLLQSFDKIYIIDLHGNARKKETAPDGSPDKNIFDIMQGVSINLFVKTGKKKSDELARVFHHDLYGERASKHLFLSDKTLSNIDFEELKPISPHYFFLPKDWSNNGKYTEGFSINQLFPVNSIGVITARDKFTIYHTARELQIAIARFRTMQDEEAREHYSLGPDARDWKINLARKDLEVNVFGADNDKPMLIDYRPFDTRYTYYSGKSRGFLCKPRRDVMRHFIDNENIGLNFHKYEELQVDFAHIFVTRHIAENSLTSSKTPNYQAPLYLYPEVIPSAIADEPFRTPNLNPNIVHTIADGLGLRFTPEVDSNPNTFAPIDILDYIYAILHAPSYRQRYREFLKIDFPHVPYPTDCTLFRRLVGLGGQLRALHLMENPDINTFTTTYNIPGDNVVTTLEYRIDTSTRLGRVSINKTQYFGGVSEVAWDCYVGGYQPARKWLKDRKGRVLTHHDVAHYQRIIVVLVETVRLMGEVDGVLGEGGGKEGVGGL